MLPSTISPKTDNWLSIIPLRRVPITIKLGEVVYNDDLHIYTGVSGVLIWKAAMNSGILLASYPYPDSWLVTAEKQSSQGSGHKKVQVVQASCGSIAENFLSSSHWYIMMVTSTPWKKFHIRISCKQCCTILCKNTQNDSICLQGEAKGRARYALGTGNYCSWHR